MITLDQFKTSLIYGAIAGIAGGVITTGAIAAANRSFDRVGEYLPTALLMSAGTIIATQMGTAWGLKTVQAKYKAQLADLQGLDPSTMAVLAIKRRLANPNLEPGELQTLLKQLEGFERIRLGGEVRDE